MMPSLGCDCGFEMGSIECYNCLREFVEVYNQDNPNDPVGFVSCDVVLTGGN